MKVVDLLVKHVEILLNNLSLPLLLTQLFRYCKATADEMLLGSLRDRPNASDRGATPRLARMALSSPAGRWGN